MTTEVEPVGRDLAARGTAIRYAEQALELEADALRHRDWAGELLLDAATAWRDAGERERAIAVLRELVAAGGEDGQFARVLLAEVCFELGRDDDARAELTALKFAPPCSPEPCEAAAELLEERGELVLAAEWYDAAASALNDDELAALDGEFGWASYPAHVLLGRSRVRRLLGVAPDELDRAVCRARERRGTRWFPSTDDVLAGQPGARLGTREVRTLFWQRPEFYASRERWPALFDSNGADPDAYHRRLEDGFRELSGRGVARVTLVPGTAEGLDRFAVRTGGDPAEGSTRHAYTCELVEAGETIAWPPPRNGPVLVRLRVQVQEVLWQPPQLTRLSVQRSPKEAASAPSRGRAVGD
jgi:hypothetical protein